MLLLFYYNYAIIKIMMSNWEIPDFTTHEEVIMPKSKARRPKRAHHTKRKPNKVFRHGVFGDQEKVRTTPTAQIITVSSTYTNRNGETRHESFPAFVRP